MHSRIGMQNHCIFFPSPNVLLNPWYIIQLMISKNQRNTVVKESKRRNTMRKMTAENGEEGERVKVERYT